MHPRYLLIALLVFIPVLGRAQSNVVFAPHASDLVGLKGSNLMPLSAMETEKFLEASYTVLYFGAGWCPDCRRFSSALVSAYDQRYLSDQHFEVLLMTEDKTEADMVKYMLSEEIKCPAMSFYKMRSSTNELKRYYTGNGIPCVTVIDQKGAVILQSKSDQDGADILKQLLALVAKK